jgi:SAM-dependent methyltransferase
MPAYLDDPPRDALVDPLCVWVRGWVWLDAQHADIVAIEAWCGGTLVGATRALQVRPDVAAALRLGASVRTGFELFAHVADFSPGQPLDLHVAARLRDGALTAPLASVRVTAIARDYRTNHFGVLLDRSTIAVQRHRNIFATGPSQATGSAELVRHLLRHLPAPPCRVIDVGCGLGYYGRELLAQGYDWLGAEVKAADCAELARAGLPHRQVDGGALPFADGAFCIEVLEHIEDPRPFLAEVRRVAPRRLIVSVPNCELLGYLHDHLSAPWHMLEPDHKNFFTRWSLGSLLREFYAEAEVAFHTPFPLRTPEGTPLHYNLLAVATTPA